VPEGANVVNVPAASEYHVSVPTAQLLVMFTALAEQIGVLLNTGASGIGLTTCVTVANGLGQFCAVAKQRA
jgi:hypothetical protein